MRDMSNECADHRVRLDACKCLAEADMRSATETQIASRLTIDPELVAVVIPAFITVGGGEDNGDAGIGRQRVTAKLACSGGRSGEDLRWRVKTQHLVEGSR